MAKKKPVKKMPNKTVASLDSVPPHAAESPANPSGSSVSSPLEWHVAIGKRQSGPHALPQVQAMIEEGQLTADALVWKPGMEAWISLAECPDLAKTLMSAKSPSRT